MSNNTTESSRLEKYLENAHATVDRINLYIDNDDLCTAVSRMYYACFYSVSALLLHKGIKVDSHSGIRQMLGLHYVKPGMFPAGLSRFYTELYNSRIEGDYNPFAEFQHENVRQLYLQAVEFIDTVDELLVKLGTIQGNG
jgi:uncharacterized protein (UPF0332 family)